MTHTLNAIAWTLIHFCWQAAAAAGLYRLASLALARRSSNTRYVAALGALLAMLAASVLTFAWEMRSNSSSPSPATFTAFIGDGRAAHASAPAPMPGTGASAMPAPGLQLPELLPSQVFPLIDAIWVCGVIVLSLRSLGGWWLIQRLRATATVEAPPAVRDSFRRIAGALGIVRPVVLRVSSAIAGPVTVGAVRAMVLLPLTAATSLSADELEVVLAHELAHVRRADFLWNLVQTLVETLFFFHPAVWWIGASIRHERELCCDDLALTVCPNPVVYAQALYRLEEQRSRQLQLAMALDGHQSRQTLRMRIARILGEPIALTANRGPFSLAAVAAVLVVLLMPVPQLLASLNPAPKPASHAALLQQPSGTEPVEASVAVKSEIPAGLALPPVRPVALAVVRPMMSQAEAQATATGSTAKGDYIDQMKAAGYDVDLDKLLAMKIQDVTPEYAHAMSQIGYGKLSADQLIACKIQDVTPEFITQIKAAGYDVNIDKLIAMKIQDVTPDYARDMEKLGFGKLSADDLIASKIQDVTPEYVAKLKQDGLEVKSVQEAIQYRIFDVTPEFMAQMKAAGFGEMNHDQLMAMRVQGVTPEYAKMIRQQFPNATVDEIVKTKIFNIDADFIASAKRHGFTNLGLEKLVQLRISGILDDEGSK